MTSAIDADGTVIGTFPPQRQAADALGADNHSSGSSGLEPARNSTGAHASTWPRSKYRVVRMPEKISLVPGAGNSTPAISADPFDLDALRVSQDFAAMAGVKKQLITVPVRKPNKQDFVRVHPSEGYRINLHMIVLQDDREAYAVRPELYADLSNELTTVTLFTAVNRQGVVFLWPVRLPSSDAKTNAWWTSARTAAEQAMTKWVRVSANQSLGAYEVLTAENCTIEPEWPELPLQELIRIAFKDRIVDSVDHPVVRRLRGLT